MVMDQTKNVKYVKMTADNTKVKAHKLQQSIRWKT